MKNFFDFIKERQSIYHKRLEGQPAPWTNDSILSKYRFCNVFREYDKGSQFVINLQKTPGATDKEIIFNTILYRKFTYIETIEKIGFIKEPFNLSEAEEILGEAHSRGEQLFTGAFMITADIKRGGLPTYKTVLHTMTNLEIGYLTNFIFSAKTGKEIYEELRKIKGCKNFLAYQVYVDLTYWDKFPYDEEEFTIAGPGAIKGLQILGYTGNWEKAIEELCSLQYRYFTDEERSMLFKERIYGKQCLNIMAIENCLCEYQKYYALKNGLNTRVRKF